jgi:hypothetical protein
LGVPESLASQSSVDLVEQHARSLFCGHLTLIRPDLAPLRRGFSLLASGAASPGPSSGARPRSVAKKNPGRGQPARVLSVSEQIGGKWIRTPREN